tara:strand:- start:3902 stop:4072 length:171 start_codon:yes stop_codon:yes gene_type:complete
MPATLPTNTIIKIYKLLPITKIILAIHTIVEIIVHITFLPIKVLKSNALPLSDIGF